ncbi:MAG: phosphoglycerate kinase [Patescibacteria group bacterium]|nr:phosphoglycerate kinase [Patescibacteria group bacterium]
MNNQLLDVRKVDVKGKKVFLRADLNAPISEAENGEWKIEDDTRLVESLPTLNYLLENGASVILVSHLRRPEGYDPKLSLLPIAKWLAKELKLENNNLKIEKLGEFDGWKLTENLFLLENIRFYKEEKENNTEFTKRLASLADIYVNDAFASSHREHASIIGAPKILPHFAGIRLQKEIEVLSGILENPKRALVVIIGGAKIETKLPLVEKMHRFADYVLIGGKIATESTELIKVQHESISGKKSILLVAELNEQRTDITLKSAENFLQIISIAETVVWNGPLGHTDGPTDEGKAGSRLIAEGILSSKAYSVVGGGDTLEFLKKLGKLSAFNFFSTGGGAMLAFLSGEELPGVEVLKY